MATVDRIKFIHALLNDTRGHLIMSLFEKANNISGLLKHPKLGIVSKLCDYLLT